MKAKVWMCVVSVAVLVLAATLAGAQMRDTTGGPASNKSLGPEQQALVDETRDLGQRIRIARLELRLAEAKGASEKEIAAKAEQLYRLQGKLHGLFAKHPELRAMMRHRTRHAWRGADGLRPGGPGMGRMRRGMGTRARGCTCPLGRGTGRRMGHGWGWGGGQLLNPAWRGGGEGPGQQPRFRERQQLRLHPSETAAQDAIPGELEPSALLLEAAGD